MQVIATAGHVDHGKSALVRALTGTDPDRWAEERRRGLSIDLGFAWLTLPSGERLAFVDVPGHERFVPNMLAGIGPVPAVLFVVAADEGWMPQSAEHLAALDALGVRHGLLAVTRADLADPGPAAAEAARRIAVTSLGPVECVAVSAVTGEGLPGLIAALDRLAAELPAPDPAAPVRLWVDRAFTVTGSGTVVTGTLRGRHRAGRGRNGPDAGHAAGPGARDPVTGRAGPGGDRRGQGRAQSPRRQPGYARARDGAGAGGPLDADGHRRRQAQHRPRPGHRPGERAADPDAARRLGPDAGPGAAARRPRDRQAHPVGSAAAARRRPGAAARPGRRPALPRPPGRGRDRICSGQPGHHRRYRARSRAAAAGPPRRRRRGGQAAGVLAGPAGRPGPAPPPWPATRQHAAGHGHR